MDDNELEKVAAQLALFLKELQSITFIDGPVPGQHNWWRGDHVSVYNEGARKQIHNLSCIIDENKASTLWEKACKTQWNKAPVWIHGDFSSGNILIKDGHLSGVIDFGGMAVGDPNIFPDAFTFLIGSFNLDRILLKPFGAIASYNSQTMAAAGSISSSQRLT